MASIDVAVQDMARRRVLYNRPETLEGGFLPLAALAPFAAAFGIPVAASAGKWVGKKVFGKGLRRSGRDILYGNKAMGPVATQGAGLSDKAYRSGLKMKAKPVKKINHRAGDTIQKYTRTHQTNVDSNVALKKR